MSSAGSFISLADTYLCWREKIEGGGEGEREREGCLFLTAKPAKFVSKAVGEGLRALEKKTVRQDR